MSDDLALPENTQILTPDGVYAVIGKAGRVRPETVRKATGLRNTTVRDVGETIATMTGEDVGGDKNYARLDLM